LTALGRRQLTNDEFQLLRDKLDQVKRIGGVVAANHYYKVHFSKVLELVESRRVFLSKGMAYVHRTDMVSYILTFFREHLSKALALTAKGFQPRRAGYEAITPVIETLRSSRQYLGRDYKIDPNSEKIDINTIDTVAERSFPLCMRTMHRHLRAHHHLKHTARLQYGLFLKGLGITFDEALAYWRAELSQSIGADKFDKEYAYNIRHSYGKEGRKANYTPYACMKIIHSDPVAGTLEDGLRGAANKVGGTHLRKLCA